MYHRLAMFQFWGELENSLNHRQPAVANLTAIIDSHNFLEFFFFIYFSNSSVFLCVVNICHFFDIKYHMSGASWTVNMQQHLILYDCTKVNFYVKTPIFLVHIFHFQLNWCTTVAKPRVTCG